MARIANPREREFGLNRSITLVRRGVNAAELVTPSIEAAEKLANILKTTVGYLLGETEQVNVFKNPDMLKRLNDTEDMNEDDRQHVIFTIDALIQKVKIKKITA